jgi:DNA-binding CsgD family transcriptional regulator
LRSTGVFTDGHADEISTLKACVNDLVGILTLPPMWSGSGRNEIIKTLLDVVLRTLCLDFAYARLKAIDAPTEAIRLAGSGGSSADENALRQALGQWLTDDPDTRTSILWWPAQGSKFSIVAFRLGTSEHIGEFVAGSRRPGFPSKTERLVLNVAANQAAIGLQGAQLRAEQRGIAKDLDLQVHQQSRTLASINDELKKENAQRRVAEEDLRLAEARLFHAAQVATETERTKKAKFAELQKRYALLTPRERQVLPFVVAGMLSKQTAAALGTSEITIRVHRGQIMRKMQAQSLADLIRMADNLGIQ